jgi:hypothetical protein
MKLFGFVLLLILNGVVLAPNAVARGFGGVGMGASPGFSPAMSYSRPMMGLMSPYSYGYGGYGYPYYGGWGFDGGGYYYDDPAEQTYDSSHYWDGSLMNNDNSSDSSSQAAPAPAPVTPKVSEAELLKDADQTYSWGFDKTTTKPKK